MTCYSREELLFQILLKPFRMEVWIVLVSTFVIIGAVFVSILTNELKWGYLEAMSFAQLVVISIALEKPTDISIRIGRISAFKFLFLFFVLLVPVLTTGYLGLSITSISSPLESRSMTKFDQLTKTGCEVGNTDCYISRLTKYTKYTDALAWYWIKSMRRFVYPSASWRSSIDDVIRSLEALRNTSVRGFDPDSDFVILPQSFEENVFNVLSDSGSAFVTTIYSKLGGNIDIILPKLELGEVPSPSLMEIFKLFDFIDPWHIPHPYYGNFTETRYLENEWDTELALVQCGRTALVLYDQEIDKELRYFERHYPWIKFFKSESSILSLESGWKFEIEGISVTPHIFGKLFTAGIIQLLEDWPHMMTPHRLNITARVKTLVQHREREIVKKISLGGNIQTIFYIFFTSIFISIAEALIVEINIYQKLWHGVV